MLKNTCKILNCGLKSISLGYCYLHYSRHRFKRPMDVPKHTKPSKPSEERFWKFVKKTETGCWNWLGHRDEKGYGTFFSGNKDVRAHRFSYELHNGKIEGGLWCLHKCDNPPCVRPSHLFLGTNQDNVDDCHKKGREKKRVERIDLSCKNCGKYFQKRLSEVIGGSRPSKHGFYFCSQACHYANLIGKKRSPECIEKMRVAAYKRHAENRCVCRGRHLSK